MTARPKRDNASGEAGGVGKTRSKRAKYNPTAALFPELEPPILAAHWPAPGTRAGEALEAVIAGPVNQADYWQGWRLAAYVRELVELGWCFIRRDILKPGCRRVITEYRLDHSDPGTAAALSARGL